MRKLRWILASLIALTATPGLLAAQQTGTVQGTVVDATSLRPLSGAQVFVPNTSIGTLTNQSGRFVLLNVPAGTHTLRTAIIGYGESDRTITVASGESTELSIRLESTAVALDGVIVTALGLERQARTLGVAAQQIDDDVLSRVSPSIVSSLSGAVSGVNITSSTTQGGSSRVVIRGENSLLGNNQPLFVIDGIPIDNYSGSAQGVVADQGGYDYGTLINDIDPETIESLTILKGPNAAALYGSRASNGAIIIETKKGLAAMGGAQISASQTVSWEDELRMADYQNSYGQGHAGRFSYYDGAGNGVFDDWDESWGPPLDQGLMIPQFNSPVTGVDADGRAILQPLPWVSQADNIDDFFEVGNTLVSSVSVAAATDRLNGRFGFSRFDQDGMVPGFQLNRTTVSFAGGMDATEKLGLNTSVQYIAHEGDNRPATGYDGNNPMSQLGVWWGRQIDMGLLRDNYLTRFPDGHPNEGLLYNWNGAYWNNPYYHMLANENSDTRDRVLGQLSVNYQFMPWLSGLVRTSMDYYDDSRLRTWAEDNCCGTYTTNPLTASRDYVQASGAFGSWDLGFQEINTDFLFSANPDLNLPVSTSFNFGGNRRDQERTQDYTWVGSLATPGIFNVGNAASQPDRYVRQYHKRVNSLYGQAEFGLNDYAFVTLTGRNDWSSTLPEANNSYFYPSVSGSLIFSDLIPSLRQSDMLTYGKLRASWARVGNDTNPYLLQNTYIADEIYDGNPTFTVPNELLNSDLKPETTESYELGIELAGLNDRLGFDATVYTEETRDQIFNVNISPTTGYSSRYLNAGSVENKGVEMQLMTVPIQRENFRWQSSFTWSTNESTVVSLAEDVEGLEISLGNFWGVSVYAREGEPYGQLVGTGYRRVESGPNQGRIVVGAAGQPLQADTLMVIGNFNPDWRGGWQNQLSLGLFNLSSLLDVKKGGDIFSMTKAFGTYTGVLAETDGKGRCLRASTLAANPTSAYPLCTAETGIIFDGVRDNGDGTYTENATPIDGETLAVYNEYLTNEADIVDGTFVKLRELSLGFDLPTSLTSRAGLSGLNISLIGRNLWLWTPDENPHFDPETITEANNVQGFEYGQVPSARSIGFTVNVRP